MIATVARGVPTMRRNLIPLKTTKHYNQMKQIVILDGFTLHANDLDYTLFSELGEVTFYERTPLDLLVERAKNAEILITNKVPFSEETLHQLPNLKLIAVAATGYNIIDTKAAKSLGICVCNIPDYGTDSVAQHTFALLLELTNHVGKNAQSVAQGNWVKAIDWCYSLSPIRELSGKTMGIIGFGRIGQKTAEIAKAFGMKVLYVARTNKNCDWAEYVSLEELVSQSDVISLHCPATPENTGFIDKKLLEKMKPTTLLLNTSRGQLIQEQDLADALNRGVLAGAALDVLSVEPPKEQNPLLTAQNCLITPHNAWISKEARGRIVQTLYQNIQAFLAGKPQHEVA